MRRHTDPPSASGAAPEPADDIGESVAPGTVGPPTLVATIAAASVELSELRAQVVAFIRDNGGSDDVVDDVELIVSELATNVVRHTSDTDITLTVRVDQISETGEVTHDPRTTPAVGGRQWTLHMTGASDLPDLDTIEAPPIDQVGGRGLLIVRAVADDVEVDRAGGTVRCSLVG